MIFHELFVAFHASGVYTDDDRAGFCEIAVTVPEGTGFLRADTALVLRIKINDQDLFAQVISDVKHTVVLVP